MGPPTITNSVVMNSNENSWEDLPDKEVKRTIKTVFKQLIGGRNILQEKSKELNELKNSIQNMKTNSIQ